MEAIKDLLEAAKGNGHEMTALEGKAAEEKSPATDYHKCKCGAIVFQYGSSALTDPKAKGKCSL